MKAALLPGLLILFSAAWGQAQDWGPSALMGGPGGDHTLRSLACASGKHAIGVQVYAGIYIHGLYLECASLGPAGEHTAGEMVGIVGSHLSGTAKQLRCNGGEVLVGFKGRSGLWLDRIQIACKTWSRANGGAEGTVQWRSAAGGTGGQSYGPIYCPGKYGVSRVVGIREGNPLYGDLVISYQFYCRGT
jgi:hypothetical protein